MHKIAQHVENLICADPLLGRLDETLAFNYDAMLTVDLGRSRQSLRAEQLAWLARRNRCKDVQCLLEAYKARVDETCEYGVAAGVHPSCSMTEDVMAHQVQARTERNACQLTEREMLGQWRRISTGGFHEEMAFESDTGRRRFDSWSHGRPEFSGGSWSLENCAIHIGHSSLRSLDSTLDVVSYRKVMLSLRDQRTQQAAVYVRMP